MDSDQRIKKLEEEVSILNETVRALLAKVDLYCPKINQEKFVYIFLTKLFERDRLLGISIKDLIDEVVKSKEGSLISNESEALGMFLEHLNKYHNFFHFSNETKSFERRYYHFTNYLYDKLWVSIGIKDEKISEVKFSGCNRI